MSNDNKTRLTNGYQARFDFERFERTEARAARDQLRTEAFERATAGRQAWETCARYPLGYLKPGTVSRYGGRTTCEILNGQGEIVAVGTADCSLLDEFDADLGTMIALGRAVKTL